MKADAPKVAIYARVSTQQQKNDMQLYDLRKYAKAQGWQAVEYIEKESSRKTRPVFQRMLADARTRKFEIVMVWKIDRFARSMKQFIDTVLELDKAKVRFIALTQNIDSDQQGAMGRFLLHLYAALAELEREIIVERVKAGIAQAQREGKHCGRPATVFARERARRMRERGATWRAIAAELQIDQSTLRRGLRAKS